MSCRIVLLGVPGAGKGTQAELLTEALGIPHIASGELFREHLTNETELGKLARSYIERGDLVPDAVTIKMVTERLERPDCATGFVLDGFPRTVAQAEALMEALDEIGVELGAVPLIDVGEEEALKRLAGRWTCRRCGDAYHILFNPPEEEGVCDDCGGELYQRPDDSPQTHQHRIKVYRELTMPLINYYRQAGLLVEVDGEQPIEQVQADLRTAIGTACNDR